MPTRKLKRNVWIKEIVMGLFSKIKDFLRGPIYRINREVLADYMNNEIQFSVENNLSACGEFYLSPSEDEPEEHIIITNNDAPCKCPMESEKDFTGITIYANRSSYYDPEKDEIYRTVDEFIRFKLNEFPEWFIFRGETSDLDKYMIKK